MSDTVYLQYWIYIEDKAEAERLGAVVDPNSNQAAGAIIRAPEGAAVEFNAPILGKNEPWLPGVRCIASDYFGTEANYPTNVAKFTRKVGGWFGIPLLFGKTIEFYWRGVFKYSEKPEALPAGEARVTMARRRWIDGFEAPTLGAGFASGSNNYDASPAASRHLGGLGLAVRGNDAQMRHQSNEREGGGAVWTYTEQWERFYLRVHRYPTKQTYLWKHVSTPATVQGTAISIDATGHLQVQGCSSTNSWVQLGTCDFAALEFEKWYRVDVIFKAKNDATGYFDVYIRGQRIFHMLATQMPSSTSVNGANKITYSYLGQAGNTDHGGSWDFDDWVGADVPVAGGYGTDWLHGSKIVRARCKAFGASNGTWVGPGGTADAADWRFLNQRPVEQSANLLANHQLTTSVASDRLVGVVDTEALFAEPQCMGMVGMAIGRYGKRADAALNGSIGYKLPGAAEVLTEVAETLNSWTWANASYLPELSYDPIRLEPGLEVSFVANSSASSKTIAALAVQIELIGDFYPEDRVPQAGDPEDLATLVGREHVPNEWHNRPYPDSPWAKPGPPPLSLAGVKGGTYVGNGKSVQLAFRAPVCLLVIRRVAGSHDGLNWLSSSIAGHHFSREQVLPAIYAMVDPNFAPANEDDQSMQVLVRITGNAVNTNNPGDTYQYLAVMDPGMRFFECSQLRAVNAVAAASTPLATGMTAEAVLAERISNNNGVTGLFLASLGAADGEVFIAGSAKVTDSLSRAAGKIDTTATCGILSAGGQTNGQAFVAVRRDDGSSDPNKHKLVSLATWTGDGGGGRTITFAPATGRRPMWALVMGSNGATRYRDPSHTGTTSTTPPSTAAAADGITGGAVDTISVGTALNTAGVVFDAIVFWAADATAGNGGWGVNGENIPVEPAKPTGNGNWGAEPALPSEPPVEPEPEPEPGTDESYDFSSDCVVPSVKVMNLALSRIGVSKQIGDILTETSAEATAGRLHYSDDVTEVLRAFPWPFATRYADLELVMGDATLQDTIQDWFSDVRYEVGEVVLRAGVVYYALLAGTNHDPATSPTYWSTSVITERANKDWLFAFRVPDRFVFGRRLVNPNLVGRAFDPDPPKWRLGADERGQLIYTDELNPQLEYTYRPTCAALAGDQLFRTALAWRLALSFCAPLARDEKKVTFAKAMYEDALARATRWAASEQQQAPEGDANWILER